MLQDQDLSNILNHYKEGVFNWADARRLLKSNIIAKDTDWDIFFQSVYEIQLAKGWRKKELKVFIPGHSFPAISVTGGQCDLKCEHCSTKYLHSMIQGEKSTEFIEELYTIQKKGGNGCLLSGGSTKDGIVPITKFEKEIKLFRRDNSKEDFYFNAHVGLVDFADAMRLGNMGINTVSFDLIADQRVIDEVFHIDNCTVEDYLVSYSNLADTHTSIRVVPHILIGAYFGQIERELDALKMIHMEQNQPDLIVLIAMMPPKNDERFSHLSALDIAKLVFIAKAMNPEKEISLGCMRPRNVDRMKMEQWAFLGGANRMEIPMRRFLKWVGELNVKINQFDSCCSLEEEALPIFAH